MNKNLLIVLGVLVTLFIAISLYTSNQETTVPSEPADVMEEEEIDDGMTFTLSEQKESGESGLATLALSEDGEVSVNISMEGHPADTPQPAHIHSGSCPDVGDVVYPLENAVNGESVTELGVLFSELKANLPLAINVHKSSSEASVYTSCGDLLLN